MYPVLAIVVCTGSLIVSVQVCTTAFVPRPKVVAPAEVEAAHVAVAVANAEAELRAEITDLLAVSRAARATFAEALERADADASKRFVEALDIKTGEIEDALVQAGPAPRGPVITAVVLRLLAELRAEFADE